MVSKWLSAIVEMGGVVKYYFADKAYGFIVPDNGGPDVLIMARSLKPEDETSLIEGTRVHFWAVRRRKGWVALQVLAMDHTCARSLEKPSAWLWH